MSRANQFATFLLTLLYRIYASVIALFVIFILFCPLIILAPGLGLRRWIGRLCVRCALALGFIPFKVRGQENLPDSPCVVVANHASYLDGLVLTAALPGRFTFVVQDGAANWPYVGLVIRRMGVAFINRTDKREGVRQTRELINRLKNGASLAVFPEGTFTAQPGLLPFRRGAFLIAVRGGTPVVPVSISGTRRLFGEGQRLLRWSPVVIEIGKPIISDSANELSIQSRAFIAAHHGESGAD